MPEFVKYLLRFGIVIFIAAPIIAFTQGENAVRLVLYKSVLVVVAVGVAELIWSAFFRTVYGRTQHVSESKFLPIMLFRGLLYSAIILAFSLGL